MLHGRGELYFQTKEIVIDSTKEYGNQILGYHRRIVDHQLAGLRSMGCNIERNDSMVAVFHPSKRQPFYNRVIDVHMDELTLDGVIHELPCGTSIEVTPFSLPTNCESILDKNGFMHTLSTVVLAKELLHTPVLPDIPFDVVNINSLQLAVDGLSLFSTFFKKPDETDEHVAIRYKNNLGKGPHLVVFDKKKPIATIGAIIEGDTASVYNGIVLAEYRSSGLITQRLCLEMEKYLCEAGVGFYYYKTRNRAVATLAPRYLGLKSLYNERIYEKN